MMTHSARSRAGRAEVVLRGVALCALGALLSSCAYYNSMYYANRYRKEAEKAERSGRTAEAGERWRLAAVHADSQISRHPRSRWTDDAWLVRGKAMLALRRWSEAAVALESAARLAGTEQQRREAQLYLGEAHAGAQRLDQALIQLDSAILLDNERLRSRALLARGRILLLQGRPAEALQDLRASGLPEASADKIRAALALNDRDLVVSYADSLADSRAPYRETVWLPLLDTLAGSGLQDWVTTAVNRLSTRNDATPAARSRLMLAEGDRRRAVGDLPGALDLYRAVVNLAGDSVEARLASTRMIRLELASTRDPAVLPGLAEQLQRVVQQGGEPGVAAGSLLRLLNLADALANASGPADAWWFYRAELLRDSIGARPLAADAFAAMATQFPDSPWTPKALLAAIAAGHPSSDSLTTLLTGRYADNAYTQASRGVPGAEATYAVLEDSLQSMLLQLPGRGRPGQDRVQPLRPGQNPPQQIPQGPRNRNVDP